MSGVMVAGRVVPRRRDARVAGVRAAVIAGVAGRVLLGGVWAGGGCQPLGAASVLSFANAATSSAAHGQVCWRWSFARRPENASRPATCSSL